MEKEPVKVLIIDDEPGHIHWMSMLYKSFGLRAFGALDLEQAREILTKENPDIVTIETYMHDGIWFLEEIKKLDPWATRVVLTTENDPDYFDFVKTIGMAEYALNKPHDEEELERLTNTIKEIASLIRA